jgi:hypothetical protein
MFCRDGKEHAALNHAVSGEFTSASSVPKDDKFISCEEYKEQAKLCFKHGGVDKRI